MAIAQAYVTGSSTRAVPKPAVQPLWYLVEWWRDNFNVSGGLFNARSLSDSRRTGTIGIDVRTTAASPAADALVLEESAASLISRIKSSFGLNLKQTAAILRVGRPTIYAWMNDDVNIQPKHLYRLQMLAELAQAGAPSVPLDVSADAELEGSLFSMLAAPVLDRKAIESALGRAASGTLGSASRVEGRLAALGISAPSSADNYEFIVGPAVLDSES